MKKLLLATIALLFLIPLQAEITIHNATGISAETKYSTLRDAFDAINDNPSQAGNDIKVEISTSIANDSRARLNAGNWNSLVIYPTADNVVLSGNMGLAIISLFGANNVTIDGRVDRAGDTPSMTIRNNSPFGGAVSVEFMNSAQHNTLQYCIIQGQLADNSRGIVFFGSASVGDGNNHNIVQYNNIRGIDEDQRPRHAIASNGTGGRDNKYNQIINNNIFDWANKNATSNGISLINASDYFTIEGNSFYEKVTDIEPQGGFLYYAIRTNTNSVHYIENNYIGGNAAGASGTWRAKNSSAHFRITGIFTAGKFDEASIVRNNVITGFEIVCGGSTGNHDTFDGIFIQDGNVDVTHNTIGAATGNDAIHVRASSTARFATAHGILNNSTGTVRIAHNIVGAINIEGTDSYSHSFEGIYLRGRANITYIEDNQFGSLETANSIHVSGTAENSSFKQDNYAIFSASQNTTYIRRNTIANMHNAYTGSISTSRTRPIRVSAGSNFIEDNIIHDISTTSTQPAIVNSSASVIGIELTANTAETTQVVSGNTIYNLRNTHAEASAAAVYGIYIWGPSNAAAEDRNMIAGNFIRELSASNDSENTLLIGIVLHRGYCNAFNNVVSLGRDVTSGYRIFGLWDNSGSLNNNYIYHNTLVIEGNVTTGSTPINTALWNQGNTSIRDYRNNIFVNQRTLGGNGDNNLYPIRIDGLTNLTVDYNNYFGIGGRIGRVGNSALHTELSGWQGQTQGDQNSLSKNPDFINETNNWTEPQDFLTDVNTELEGEVIDDFDALDNDFDGIARTAGPKMGAFEDNLYSWTGNLSKDFGTEGNWLRNIVPPDGVDVIFVGNVSNTCQLDKNRRLRSLSIENDTGENIFELNGQALTLTSSLNIAHGGLLDGTAASSSLVLAGNQLWELPAGALKDKTLAGLTLENPAGFALQEELTISEALVLTEGALDIGTHTLTLNGSIDITGGSLQGGQDAGLVIGGNDAVLELPEVELGSLKINRSNGAVLSGDVMVAESIKLETGSLQLAGNTLGFAGSSLSRTGGNIDASPAGSTMLFDNAAALVLPAAVFSSTVQNMSITRNGGVSVSDDLQIDGHLYLPASNPTPDRGLLDISIGTPTLTLTLGENAYTTGTGEVTGRIERTTILPGVVYDFGHPHTNIQFYNANAAQMPTEVRFLVRIGAAPGAGIKTNTVKRYYEVVRTGGSVPTRFTLQLNYLDSELNGNPESDLVFWDHHVPYDGTSPHEHGRTSLNTTENWISLAGHSIQYLVKNEYFGELAFEEGETTPDQTKLWMISAKESDSDHKWLGAAQGQPNEWKNITNWNGSELPDQTSDIIIPADVPGFPHIPDNIVTQVRSITIEPGARLIAGENSTLEVTGSLEPNQGTASWENHGVFDAGTSTVVFTSPNAAIVGETNFYKLEIPETATLTLLSNAIVRVADELDVQGRLITLFDGPTTVEYNGLGAQTVVLPTNNTYHNLVLSGSGNKTLPADLEPILNNLEIWGSAAVLPEAGLTVNGNLVVGSATATFNTGNFNHNIRGDLDISGVLNASTGRSITFEGSDPQRILGTATPTFANLVVNNDAGLQLFTNIQVNETLTPSAGEIGVGASRLAILGTIDNTDGGSIATGAQSQLHFGGSDAITIKDDLFAANPALLGTLSLDRNGGLTLGNQGMTVSERLLLEQGTLTIASNTFTLSADELEINSGKIDARGNARFVFAGQQERPIPSDLFVENEIGNLDILTEEGLRLNHLIDVKGAMNISSNASLSLEKSGMLTVGGTLQNFAGSTGLIIESGVNGTGSLVNDSPDVEATVENYVAGGGDWNKATAWYYIAAPVVGQDIADAMEAAFSNGQEANHFDLYRWSEAQDTWINYHNTASPTFDRTVFKSGEGYIFGAPASVTLNLSGELGSGNKTWSNLSHSGTGSTLPTDDPDYYTSGWHLLGNPFPSGIVATETWTFTNIVHTPKLWNGSTYDDVSDGFIPANTAFFVQVVSSTYNNNNSLTIPFAARVHIAPEPDKNTPQNRILLVAQAQGSEMRQQHVIRLEPNAAEGFDPRYDSRFMAGYAPQLFSITATDRLSTIAITEITDSLVIPMVFRKNHEGEHFLIKLERSIPNTKLYLNDLKTDTWHELDFDKPYAFSAAAEDIPVRFELHFSLPADDDDDDGDGDDGDPTSITEATDGDATRMWYHNNHLYIQTTGTGNHLAIYNLNGHLLRTYQPEPGLQSYYINLPPGVYIARLSGNNTSETLKIITTKTP